MESAMEKLDISPDDVIREIVIQDIDNTGEIHSTVVIPHEDIKF